VFEEIRAKYFPAELIPGVTARAVDKETIGQVWDDISHRVFSPLTELGNYAMPQERRGRARRLREVYARTHGEDIVFCNARDEPIGWSSGAMIDPSTFFMSYSGVVPQYQRKGIYTSFLKVFLTYLHHLGYERVTSNHMVNNRPVLIAKLKAGFYVTGMVLDERWGAQVTLTYFFYKDRRIGFARAYSLEEYPDVPQYLSDTGSIY
jgi:RimJ/RimL family protein N-acetyltransferase